MVDSLRISFFGSSLLSSYWNGAATYYRGLLKALNALGHTITFYESDAYDRQLHRDIAQPDYASVHVYSSKNRSDLEQLMDRAARESDVLVKASGNGVFDRELEQGVLKLGAKYPQAKVCFWDVDAPATLDRVASDPNDYFRELIPRYDCIFTYGGGPPVVNGYTGWGAQRCVPVYNALDPHTHFRTPPEPRFQSDLAFLGNRLPDREHRVEEFFLSIAGQYPKRRFLLGGNGWNDRVGGMSNVAYLGHVATHLHNAFNSTPLAVLNINRESMARYGYSPPTRVFEAAGAGACLIIDAWEGLDLFLAPDEECLVVHSGRDVADVLDTLTLRRARDIGAAALKRVLNHHTYSQRASVVQSTLNDLFAGKGSAS